MKLKNVSARAYGLMGKIYAPLQEFELSGDVAIASIQGAIDSGDMLVVEFDAAEAESEDAPARRGRKPKQVEAD
ncbi:hypothetical protein UFOVP1309_20 [uncultured Caudovirales phage]|uniref:Uncharacterized protein n=1 Tax=uncultured Caudovirales phage TaxID=2100421 RepID=A0A6J5RNC1_9CAUD|nr:hypothetical protein UFOVP1309_20 [uncultured Caudovirales phage]